MTIPIATSSEKLAEEATRWQSSLKRAFRSPRELAEYVELDCSHFGNAILDHGFPMLVTREFASRMKKADWNDPLLKQVWPADEEAVEADGFRLDPVGDGSARVEAGLLHKYEGRVLLIVTGACAIHCRYCFRRHYPYSDEPKSIRQWEPAIEHIRSDESIHEVILSGGDPLTLTDRKLRWLVEAIESIPHVERLRIHTRLPIVLPSRVDDLMLSWLETTRLSAWLVVHCNHRNEIDDEVCSAIRRMRSTGAVVLNQAVLLSGVNDSEKTVEELCRELIRISVVPYYLHALDRVQGAAHFEVSLERSQAIMEHLRRKLPGYAVPKLVRELPGEPSKSPVG